MKWLKVYMHIKEATADGSSIISPKIYSKTKNLILNKTFIKKQFK